MGRVDGVKEIRDYIERDIAWQRSQQGRLIYITSDRLGALRAVQRGGAHVLAGTQTTHLGGSGGCVEVGNWSLCARKVALTVDRVLGVTHAGRNQQCTHLVPAC